MTVYSDDSLAKNKRVVYFAEHFNGNVKIGTTRRLSERKKELSFLLGQINVKYVFASSRLESELHRRYKPMLLHNETFSVRLSDIIKAVEEDYDELDYIQEESHARMNNTEHFNLDDFSAHCENIDKLKMFKTDFSGYTFSESLTEYINNNKDNDIETDVSWIEDKTDLFISIYEPRMPNWLIELLLDYDVDKIEHEYLIYYIINNVRKEKNCIFKLVYLNNRVQELESKIAGFIEISDTTGKDDKEVYAMVKSYVDSLTK